MFAISLLALVILVVSRSHTYWGQSDAVVYRDAGRSLWNQPGQLYRRDFSAARLPFTYTPFAAVLFAAVAGLSFPLWQIGLALAGVAALLVSARSALTIAGVAGRWQKTLILAAVCLWLEPVDMTLFFGQINLILTAFVLADFALPTSSRFKGVGIGVATGLKLTPLIFIAYLLLTGRWRTARTSLATVAGTVVLGAVLLPSSSWRYWSTTVSRAGDDPSRLVNQSLNGLLRRAIHPGGTERAVWLLAAGLVLVAGLLIARAAASSGRELAGVCAAGATGLLVSPISWTHHYVYVLAVLALACSTELTVWVRRVLAAVTIVCFGWWPLPAGQNGWESGVTPHPSGLLRLVGHNSGRELHWNLWQFLAGNAYVWAALAFLLLVAVTATSARAAGEARPAIEAAVEAPAAAQNPPTDVFARSRLRITPVGALSIAVFAISVLCSFAVYRQFRAGYDLGIFDQAIAHYSQFKAPLVPLKGPHFNILGDHFHPILAALAPLYWIVDDPRVLLVAQAALVSASIPIVHRFAARRRSSGQALTIAGGYALGWPLQAMIRFDFHEIAFAVVLIAWAIDSLDRADDRGLLVACGLLVLVREDMGILVVTAGLLRLTFARRPAVARRRGVAITLIAGGIAMYWLSTDVVLPHFASAGRFAYWTYDALGKDPGSALTSIVTHPWHAVRLFFTPDTKTRTLLLLLAPLAFLSLRSRYLLLALPVFAEQFFTSRQALWTTEYYYWAISWPILTMAAIDGAARLSSHRLVSSGLSAERRRLLGWGSAALPLVFALIGTCLPGSLFPFHELLDGMLIGRTAHMRALQRAVDQVPAGTCVVTDDRIAVHLAPTNLVSLPGRLGRAADFTVLDLTRPQTGSDTPTPQQTLQAALKEGDREVFSRQDVVVLRAADYHGPSPSCRP